MSEVIERVRFSVADFYKMGETGILDPKERVELIDGAVVRMAPIGGPHAWGVDRLARAAMTLSFADRAHVSIQGPLVLSEHDAPQSDVMLLRPPATRYKTELPRAADVLLLIEVADSSLIRDTRLKLPRYARFGVPEVWVFDLSKKMLLAYGGPQPDGTYRERRELTAADSIAPAAFPDFLVGLAELLA